MNLRNGQSLFILLAVLMLSACQQKRVLIMGSGSLTIDGTTISLNPGTTHTEKELMTKSSTVTVKLGTTEMPLQLPEGGLYLLNMKPDTLIGSFQSLSEQKSAREFTLTQLRSSVDSLEQLLQGKNVSAAHRNFFILPGNMVKVTDQLHARIIGPFHGLPRSIETGDDTELYKFYTNKEGREILENLKKFLD
ncbi:MAG: hypothetical protein ACKO6K_07350 [Chitinophagaceae bacterium]